MGSRSSSSRYWRRQWWCMDAKSDCRQGVGYNKARSNNNAATTTAIAIATTLATTTVMIMRGPLLLLLSLLLAVALALVMIRQHMHRHLLLLPHLEAKTVRGAHNTYAATPPPRHVFNFAYRQVPSCMGAPAVKRQYRLFDTVHCDVLVVNADLNAGCRRVPRSRRNSFRFRLPPSQAMRHDNFEVRGVFCGIGKVVCVDAAVHIGQGHWFAAVGVAAAFGAAGTAACNGCGVCRCSSVGFRALDDHM